MFHAVTLPGAEMEHCQDRGRGKEANHAGEPVKLCRQAAHSARAGMKIIVHWLVPVHDGPTVDRRQNTQRVERQVVVRVRVNAPGCPEHEPRPVRSD